MRIVLAIPFSNIRTIASIAILFINILRKFNIYKRYSSQHESITQNAQKAHHQQ